MKKNHWETVYETKDTTQVSWAQVKPNTSINIIKSFGLKKDVKILDVGGGDSKLVDYLLDEGYENITVLDISSKALDNAKKRLGDKAMKVNWIVSDITDFKPSSTFDVWHDRAVFHFLTNEKDIAKYIDTARKSIKRYLTIGTFSENGPKKCSGLDVRQYTEKTLTEKLENGFEKMECFTEDHITPFDTIQNFLFCNYKKK